MTDTEANSPNGMIRVVDDEGHLIFIFNPTDRYIEFKPIRGRRLDCKSSVLYRVSTDKLRSAGTRNLLTDSPVHEFVAEVEVLDD